MRADRHRSPGEQMNNLLQPDPVLLGFLFFKKFVYLEVLALLALIRVTAGRGLARWPALMTLVLCLGGIATTFAPALGLNEGPLYVTAAQLMAGGGGLGPLLVPSAIFLICSVTPRARWRIIDLLHLVMLSGLLIVWWWVS
ncbi:hypothetical protein SSE37_07723 [Sagittula stellata E-37]|uniref:Uncharacterized protein n=2 Tax=Sagittula stellata TaxID=52603 RepID=A3JYX6_SAGS3|nr:hypothetical protein SSE37_07723 [Sagittula stellata E-37]